MKRDTIKFQLLTCNSFSRFNKERGLWRRKDKKNLWLLSTLERRVSGWMDELLERWKEDKVEILTANWKLTEVSSKKEWRNPRDGERKDGSITTAQIEQEARKNGSSVWLIEELAKKWTKKRWRGHRTEGGGWRKTEEGWMGGWQLPQLSPYLPLCIRFLVKDRSTDRMGPAQSSRLMSPVFFNWVTEASGPVLTGPDWAKPRIRTGTYQAMLHSLSEPHNLPYCCFQSLPVCHRGFLKTVLLKVWQVSARQHRTILTDLVSMTKVKAIVLTVCFFGFFDFVGV